MRSAALILPVRWKGRPQQNCRPTTARCSIPSTSKTLTAARIRCGVCWTAHPNASSVSTCAGDPSRRLRSGPPAWRGCSPCLRRNSLGENPEPIVPPIRRASVGTYHNARRSISHPNIGGHVASSDDPKRALVVGGGTVGLCCAMQLLRPRLRGDGRGPWLTRRRCLRPQCRPFLGGELPPHLHSRGHPLGPEDADRALLAPGDPLALPTADGALATALHRRREAGAGGAGLGRHRRSGQAGAESVGGRVPGTGFRRRGDRGRAPARLRNRCGVRQGGLRPRDAAEARHRHEGPGCRWRGGAVSAPGGSLPTRRLHPRGPLGRSPAAVHCAHRPHGRRRWPPCDGGGLRVRPVRGPRRGRRDVRGETARRRGGHRRRRLVQEPDEDARLHDPPGHRTRVRGGPA